MSSYSNSRLRSSPIAIHRSNNEDAIANIPLATSSTNNIKRREIDSDDEGEDFILQAGGALAALQLDGDISYVGSVPTKPRGMRRRAKPSNNLSSSLPAAPMLSSRGGIGFDASNSPPPMALTEQSESGLLQSETPVYGSLRDSHLEGKFLDGPASYRDRSSGQLHPLRHNQQIRLDDSATSYHAPSSLTSRLIVPPQRGPDGMGDWSRLTPGERILAATTTTPPNSNVDANTNASKPPTTSTLSSMMQGDPLPQQQETNSSPNNITTFTSVISTASSGGLYHREQEEDASAVLSTSLTGFEILKAASEHPELLQGRPTKSMPTYMPTPTTGFMIQPPTSLSPQEHHHLQQDYLDEEDDDLFELDME